MFLKVLDIYATSVDYQPDTEISQQFFATVQNKMHWAVHRHTAAEIVRLEQLIARSSGFPLPLSVEPGVRLPPPAGRWDSVRGTRARWLVRPPLHPGARVR